MSYADYSQTAEDHRSVLILVSHTGKRIDTRTFNRCWERIRKVQSVKVPGHDRKIWLRFKRAYPVENNEWGDFQGHRKVLGLLSVGKCSDRSEFEDLFSSYVKLKGDYSSTIFNSRLIAFGLNRDGSPLQESSKVNGSEESSDLSETEDTDGNYQSTKFTLGNVTPSSSFESEGGIRAASKAPKQTTHSGKVPLAKAESFDSLSPEEKSSPYDPLTNGRKNGTSDSAKSPTDEKKLLMNNENSKGDGSKATSQTGRPHSNSLTKESSGAEVVFFPSTNQCDDLEEKLQEFAASLFFVLESKRLDRSFERSDKMQLLCTPFEKKDYIGVDTDTRSFKRRCQGRLRKHLADLSLQASLPGEAILHYQTALDILKSVNDWLWIGACYEGLSAASVILAYPQAQSAPIKRNFSFSVRRAVSLNDQKQRTGVNTMGSASVPNGMDVTRDPKSGVNPDDIVEKYREALANYSKFKQAGVIEMEACLKACRILISQNKYLTASDFLQTVVYINIQSPEEDKVQKYSSLSTLYTQIGFHRKASFFKRIAAMQCVAPTAESQSWFQCHRLLLKALEGFNISLDPREFLSGSSIGGGSAGWPILQLRVLNELVFSARKMGNPQLIVRHMAFLLHTMHHHLSAAERREAASTLESFTANCEGTTAPVALENGLILPPVPLTRLPTVRCFKPQPLAPNLQPQKTVPKTPVLEVKSESPFIYSPFAQNNNNSSSHVDHVTDKLKPLMDFQWVCGDVCEVTLQVTNPLSDELKITHMGLLTEGVEFDAFPATPTLPAESGPCTIKLMGMPKTPGDLKILGYVTHVFGVRSLCRLKDIPQIDAATLRVQVTPVLPQLQIVTSLPKAASFFSAPEGANIVTTGTTTLFAGQSQECMVTLQNVGNFPVETVDVGLEDKYNTGILESVLSWNRENITSQLPLLPSAIGCFTLALRGTSDFLSSQGTDEDVVSPVRSFWGSKNVRSNTITSLDGSSSDTVCLETLLRIQYSGGAGLEAGFCRLSSVALSVDIQPSLAFCRWDVLPSDRTMLGVSAFAEAMSDLHVLSPDMCYLVLDGRNETRHNIEVTYDTDMTITIEPNQVRRFAVSLRRIDFPTFPEDSPIPGTKGGNHSSSQPKQHVSLQYSAVIASYVNINWHIPMLKVSGQALLDQLTWSPRQLNIIKASPLHWDVRLNSSSYDSAGVAVTSGDLVSVLVKVEPQSGRLDLANALLSIVCYQDNGSSNPDYDMEAKVVVMGTNVIPMAEIICDKAYKHSCDFVFMVDGRYSLEIRCIMGNCDVEEKNEQCRESDKWALLPAPQVIVGKNDTDSLLEEIDYELDIGTSGSRSLECYGSEFKDKVQFLEEKTIHKDAVQGTTKTLTNLPTEVAS